MSCRHPVPHRKRFRQAVYRHYQADQETRPDSAANGSAAQVVVARHTEPAPAHRIRSPWPFIEGVIGGAPLDDAVLDEPICLGCCWASCAQSSGVAVSGATTRKL